MKRLICIAFSALMISSCCSPAPWSAWEYESVIQFEEHPDAWNLPSQDEYPSLYIDGAFVSAFFRAHDETTTSGTSPYQLFVNVTTYNPIHKGVIFHSVEVTDFKPNSYSVQPIKVNRAAKKTKSLNFPVPIEFKTVNFGNPRPSKGWTKASLWTDDTIPLEPELGHEVTVEIDLEVIGEGKSTRDIVTYRFTPNKNGGIFQCISV